MNVLHLSTEKTWRGGENQIFLLAKGLREKGIICHSAFPMGSEGLENFRKSQFPSLPLPSRSPLDPRNVYAINNYCKKQNINLINTHSSGAHSLALQVKLLNKELKLVVHRRVAFSPKNNFFSKRKYLSENVDHFIAISDACALPLERMGVSKDKITRVYSGVDLENFNRVDKQSASQHFKDFLKIPQDRVLIGTASALTLEKGIHILIKAANRLQKAKIPFTLAIAGKGPLEEELEDLTEHFRLQNAVHFLGYIEDMPTFLSSLDIFVLPSIQEGLGSVILQAMASNTPVIGSDAGGIPEIVIPSETGLVYKSKSSTALARNLESFIKNPELRESIASKALVRVQKLFSSRNMVEECHSVYEKVINS